MTKAERDEIRSFCAASETQPLLANVVGQMFEGSVFDRFQSGGSFPAKDPTHPGRHRCLSF